MKVEILIKKSDDLGPKYDLELKIVDALSIKGLLLELEKMVKQLENLQPK